MHDPAPQTTLTLPAPNKNQYEEPSAHKLGCTLKLRDGRFFSFENIDSEGVVAQYNAKSDGFILPGDKVLGVNRVAGEAHMDVLYQFKHELELEILVGRPVPQTPRARNATHFCAEGTAVEI